jgi:2-methylcitrate dehydratase
MTDSWAGTVAEWLCTTHAERLTPEVCRAASRATFDTVACALGAVDEPPSQVVYRVVRSLGGTAESSLINVAAQTSVLHAVLYNGTLIRALDCNDVFFKNGVMGHPSDNIAVALAFAERQHASAREYLSAVALGYELYWRLQTNVFERGAGYGWDHVSVSGLVAAAMAGLLLRLDDEQLTHALAIGGAQVYSLSELRSGEISMMKAAANAITAHTGALGALLAAEGMTGPDALFEGSQGLMAALGKQPDREIVATVTAPVERWHIMDVSIKQYPAIGTSQSAISAVLELVREYQLRPEDVARVDVGLPDLPITRAQIADAARLDPRTRETADHSLPFLVAIAIEEGDVGPYQFRDGRWLDPGIRGLMARVTLQTDDRLNTYASDGYPATVTVHTRSGQIRHRDMLHVPGSVRNQLSDDDLGQKLRRLAGERISEERQLELSSRLLHLEAEGDMAAIGALLRGE